MHFECSSKVFKRPWRNWNAEEKSGHTDHSIIKIGLNTEESPGKLRRLSVNHKYTL